MAHWQKYWVCAGFACLLLLAMSGAHASAPKDAVGAPIGAADVVEMLLGLVIVLASVVVVGWLYSRSRRFQQGGEQIISVLAAQSLGPKERIVLVEIGGKQIVVGMTSAQVQTLHVFEERAVDSAPTAATTSAFSTRLRSALRGFSK